MNKKKKSTKREKRQRWAVKEISLVKEMGFALAKKLHRSPASVGIKFYNLTAPGRARYFAKLKAKKASKKSSRKSITRKPVARKAKAATQPLPRKDITTLPPAVVISGGD